jgi:hypothetical protein
MADIKREVDLQSQEAEKKRLVQKELMQFYGENSKNCYDYKKHMANILKQQLKQRRKS